MPPALPTHVLRSRANSFIFRFPLSILDLNGSARATWLREGAGGKPARAEAAGDAAAKKRACKLFLPPCVPTACARGLVAEDRPRAQRGGTPKLKLKREFLF